MNNAESKDTTERPKNPWSGDPRLALPKILLSLGFVSIILPFIGVFILSDTNYAPAAPAVDNSYDESTSPDTISNSTNMTDGIDRDNEDKIGVPQSIEHAFFPILGVFLFLSFIIGFILLIIGIILYIKRRKKTRLKNKS